MPLKAWIIKNEKSSLLAHCVLMAADLLKKNPHRRVQVLFGTLIYGLQLFKWRLSLTVVHPLNNLRELPLVLRIRKVLCKIFFKAHYYEVAMPVNLHPQDEKIFANNYYLHKPLQVMQLQDHWLQLTSHSGIVFKGYRILPESIHGRWAKTRKKLLKNYYRDTVGVWLQAYYGNLQAITKLTGDRTYLLTHHWFNYYHWFTETLVRMWAVKDSLDKYTLLLPESFREIGFVKQTLDALKLSNVEWVKEGVILQIPRLTLVENKPYNGHYDPQQMQQLGAFFRSYAASQPADHPDFGERIFITRKNAARRKMVNEGEIEGLLAQHGFRSVALEDFSLVQEISILSKAKYVIGMHGAGLTNILFMPPGGKVLELHLELSSTNGMHSDVYWKLASALGHGYYYQFCKGAGAQSNFFEADIIVDRVSLEENLKRLLA